MVLRFNYNSALPSFQTGNKGHDKIIMILIIKRNKSSERLSVVEQIRALVFMLRIWQAFLAR